MTDVGAGVDVDGGHRFRLIDHEVAAGLQRHLALERLADLLLDAVQIEDRPRSRVQLDPGRGIGHEGGRERDHVRMLARRVHHHAAHATRQLVPQHSQGQWQVLVNDRARLRLDRPHAHVMPQLVEVHHVLAQALLRHSLRGRSQDVPSR